MPDETLAKYRASGTGTVTTRSDCSTIGGTLEDRVKAALRSLARD
jgi:hypothetical protein